MKRTTVLIAAAAVLLTGCSNGLPAPNFEDPTTPLTTAAEDTTAAPSSVPSVSAQSDDPSVSSQSSSEPVADQEQSDREAIESTWAGYLDAHQKLAALPVDERAELLDLYAVDPILTEALGTAEEWAAQGWIGYGSTASHITWPQPVAGASTAVLMDCADYSGTGAMDAASGELMTKGGTANNTRVTAQRAAEGWRISTVEYLVDVECTQ